MKLCYFLLMATLPLATAFVGVNDFLNNLPTDLGPLLTLFGDNMTKQYLSESTAFIDYFIFAMAPIGIITAVVSTIRVCGSSALRAFIGRAQEGHGVVEAELCTSTSRDICELFNNGGITRTLGTSGIVEIIYFPRRLDNGEPNQESTKVDPISLLRPYLQSESSEWKRKDPMSWMKKLKYCFVEDASPSDPEKQRQISKSVKGFDSINTNLSLNVGIKRSHPHIFCGVALLGFVLQTGVIIMAGLFSLELQWTNTGNQSTREPVRAIVVKNPSAVLFIIGTVLLSCGMFWCAALIGELTLETVFERPKDRESEKHEVYWLQPGGNRVGSQTFPPFAYFDGPDLDKRLSKYTVSIIDRANSSPVSTLASILLTLIGYILQFIGVRGMIAYVSIAQLGVTIIMSLLRGLLRAKRIDENDNQLQHVLDKVVGHELDWLALSMERRTREIHYPGSSSSSSSSSTSTWSLGLGSEDVRAQRQLNELFKDGKPNARYDFGQAVRLRSLLAEVTGNGLFLSPSCVLWDDEAVKVRATARELGKAICKALHILYRQRSGKMPDILQVVVPGAVDKVNIKLSYDDKVVSDTPWSVDCAKIEAILGIRLWSMIAYEDTFGDLEEESDKIETHKIASPSRTIPNRISDLFGKPRLIPKIAEDKSAEEQLVDAEIISKAQIVSIPGVCSEPGSSKVIESMIEMWLGSRHTPIISETVLWRDSEREEGGLWEDTPTSNGPDWQPRKKRPFIRETDGNSTKKSYFRWFFGWKLSQDLLGPRDSPARVCFVDTRNSLLMECAKELFTAAFASMTETWPMDKDESANVEVEVQSGSLKWKNTTVDELVAAFSNHQLGSHAESMLCIIPTLDRKLKYPVIEDTARAARGYRKQNEWKSAEGLLRWACAHYQSTTDEFPATSSVVSHPAWEWQSPLARAFVELGELYRLALTGNPGYFGYEGILWIVKQQEKYKDNGKSGPSSLVIKTIVCRYADVATWVAKDRKETWADWYTDEWPPASPYKTLDKADLPEEIAKSHRDHVLYLLSSHQAAETVKSQACASSLQKAVENCWLEVVVALLDLGIFVDAVDSKGRTALSHSAELGYFPITRILIEYGAYPDTRDDQSRTPLSWAASSGSDETVRILLETQKVLMNSRDSQDYTPLANAVHHGRLSTVEVLLEAEARIGTQGYLDPVPLFCAIAFEREAIFRTLLHAGADVNIQDRKSRMTPLWVAADVGNTSLVQTLIKAGADTEARVPVPVLGDLHMQLNTEPNEYMGHVMLTPLLRAISKQNADFVDFLLSEGVSKTSGTPPMCGPDIKDRFETPLMYAIKESDCATVEVLLRHGVEKERPDDCEEYSPLILATRLQETDMMKALLEAGVSLETKDEEGRTPLTIATEQEYADGVSLLVKAGAEKYVEDENQKTSQSPALDEEECNLYWFRPGEERLIPLRQDE